MKIVVWIVQILLVLAFVMSGFMKLVTPYEEMLSQMAWVEDVSETNIIIIGILEFLGGIGLILPMIIKKYKIFVPLAAIGLSLDMLGAVTLHIVRQETVFPSVVLFVLSAFIVYGRREFLKSKN